MPNLDYKKYRLDKLVGFAKFCLALGTLCFLAFKTPGQTSQIVSVAAAFILGGSKVGSKLGL